MHNVGELYKHTIKFFRLNVLIFTLQR